MGGRGLSRQPYRPDISCPTPTDRALSAQVASLQGQLSALGPVSSAVLRTVPPGTTAIQLTQAAATAGAGSAITMVPGVYSFSSVPTGDGIGFQGYGTQFTGSYGPPGITDLLGLRGTSFFRAKRMIRAGVSDGQPNESVDYVSATIVQLPGSGVGGYQKDVRYTTLVHGDPSVYTFDGNGTTAASVTSARDGVGDDVQVETAAGQTHLRLFGRNTNVTFVSTSDGAGCLEEMKIFNNTGTDTSFFSTATSKHGLNIFSGGSTDVLTGVYLDKGGVGAFKWGYFAPQQAISVSFAQLRSNTMSNGQILFDVDRTGAVGVGGKAPTGTHFYGLAAKPRLALETGSTTSGDAAYVTFRKTSVVAYSMGVDATSGLYRLTAAEDLASAKILTALASVGLGIGGDPQAPNQGNGALYFANATTVPSGNPTGGGFLYVEAGALKYRGSGGTVTTLAAA